MSRVRLIGTEADYRQLVADGLAQAHTFDEGFVITQVIAYTSPAEKVLNVMLLGGKNLDNWKARADQALVEFARVNGCQAIEFVCRQGLAEKVKPLGYRSQYATMRKELRWAQQRAGYRQQARQSAAY